jgi:hypothetical protein
MTLRRVLLAATGFRLVLEAVPAAAQGEETIVTARKREESILRVPAIT